MNIFEEAAKNKLRFDSSVGMSGLSVEDLWDMPLTSKTKANLDSVAKVLSRKIKEEDEESFVVQKSASNKVLSLKLDIVKHIISVKLQELENAKVAKVKATEREKIMSIIAKKEDESLEGLSIEQLRARL